MLAEGIHAVRQKADGLGQVVGDDGHEDVQFEIALAGGDAHGRIVAHDLDGDHGHGFALRRVDFARHDGAARFVFRDADFADAAARSRREPADVVGDFHQVAGQGLEHAVDDDEFIFTGQGLEFIRCRAERRACQFTDDFCKADVVALRAVDARADSRAAHSQVAQKIDALREHFLVALDHAGPAAEFLAQRQGRRVLEVRAADLDDILEFDFFGMEGVIKGIHSREEAPFDEQDAGHVQARRESVVRALGMVDVVVGMDIEFLALGL